MFRSDYLSLVDALSPTDVGEQVSQYIADRYAITSADVLAKLQRRERLGPVAIAADFDLPHVEYSGAQQGVLLVQSLQAGRQHTALYLIVNVTHPDAELATWLQAILTTAGLAKLRRCHSLRELEKLIMEGKHV